MSQSLSNAERNEIEIADGLALQVATFHGAEPGLRISLLAGIHGDEEEGVLTLHRLVDRLGNGIERGMVQVIAIANPAAYAARSRDNPIDGRNLARAFPGTPEGTHSEHLAHVLTEHAIRGFDLLVDLHSGGLEYEMPFFVGYRERFDDTSRRSAAAAEAFGAPIIWAHSTQAPGRTLSAAQSLGVPAIYVEGSGGGEIRHADAERYLEGVLRVLARHSCIQYPLDVHGIVHRIADDGGNIDAAISATRAGRMVRHVSAGERVDRGQLLAEIFDAAGVQSERIWAPKAGFVMLVRRNARIAPNDTVAMIAAL